MKPSIQKVRSWIFPSDREESGAVALLCLAAVMVLALIAWVIVDAHKANKDKVMLQGAADTAAYSHAAVEARSMNMISYANIAKRSVVGTHSLYPGMFLVYTLWMIYQGTGCIPTIKPPFLVSPKRCWTFIKNAPIWVKEFFGDHTTYSGDPLKPYIMAGQNWADQFKKLVGFLNRFAGFGLSLGGGSGGYTESAYSQDVKAIDNYQRYMNDITPWWAWAEQLSRGWRSGASSVASFPPPPGELNQGASAIDAIISKINDVMSIVGSSGIDWQAHHGNDNLPVAKKEYSTGDWLAELIGPHAAEHFANAMHHRSRSEKGAKKMINILGGMSLGYAAVGVPYSREAFGDTVNPWQIDSGTHSNDGDWLKHTSNLVFAYQNDPDRLGADREKFDMLPGDYQRSGLTGVVDDELYASTGYWTASKSEITFNGEGESPNMWSPSWTARMRPVSLPGEFDDGGLNMNLAYNQALPHLALTAQVANIKGSGSGDAIMSSIRDFAVMEASTAAMGNSTVSGFGK